MFTFALFQVTCDVTSPSSPHPHLSFSARHTVMEQSGKAVKSTGFVPGSLARTTASLHREDSEEPTLNSSREDEEIKLYVCFPGVGLRPGRALYLSEFLAVVFRLPSSAVGLAFAARHAPAPAPTLCPESPPWLGPRPFAASAHLPDHVLAARVPIAGTPLGRREIPVSLSQLLSPVPACRRMLVVGIRKRSPPFCGLAAFCPLPRRCAQA
ncbi:hypothetical protein TREES_T100002927 [Tupaia chinensis]|uniref:Uncharacterized protein n=1 Tax=Tupaia chinensis TaxID=246437 RepID=L9KUN1_TUPCH|nr:hypothetical protein TREES_T100002927 [Tupaia chinensis]